MKTKDLNDLKKSDMSEIIKKEKNLKKDINQTLLEQRMGKNKDVHTYSKMRKNLATILTIKKIISLNKSEIKKGK